MRRALRREIGKCGDNTALHAASTRCDQVEQLARTPCRFTPARRDQVYDRRKYPAPSLPTRHQEPATTLRLSQQPGVGQPATSARRSMRRRRYDSRERRRSPLADKFRQIPDTDGTGVPRALDAWLS